MGRAVRTYLENKYACLVVARSPRLLFLPIPNRDR